jgi:hypothetical protein
MRGSWSWGSFTLGALVALGGATSSCDRNDASAPDAAASASAAAAGSAAVPADPVEACLQTLRVEAQSTDPRADGRMVRGCADVYKEPPCIDAHRRYDDAEPAKRAGTLTQRCAAAYCAKLPEPKPRLCGTGDVPAQQLGYLWLELRTAIWKLDLGDAQASRLEKEHLRLGAKPRPQPK